MSLPNGFRVIFVGGFFGNLAVSVLIGVLIFDYT